MKSRVYLNSAFLLRAAIGFSRHLTSAGEDSYFFNLYSIVCRISCTYFHLIRGFRFFSQKTSASMSLLLPVSSKNEGNLEVATFFPFQTTYYLNGHSFIEQELNRAQVGF